MRVDEWTYATPRIWALFVMRLAIALLLGVIGYVLVSFTIYAVGKLSGASEPLLYWASGCAQALWICCSSFGVCNVLEKFNSDVKQHQDWQRRQTFVRGDDHDD